MHSECTVLLCTCVSFLLTDATVTIVPSDYIVNESQGSVEVCASLTDVPGGGLECEVVATINTMDGPLASRSPVYTLVHVMFTVYTFVYLHFRKW